MSISFWKHYPQLDQDGRMLAQATIAYQQRFQFDFVKLTPAGTWLAVCYGAVDACQGDHLGRRTIIKPCVNNWQDWQQLPLFGHPYFPQMLTQQLIASRMVSQAMEEVDVCATVFSPLSQAIQIAGLDTFIKQLEKYPEEVEKGLTRITRNTNFVLDELAESGIKRLFYVMQHTQEHVFPATQYHQIAARHDLACLGYSASIFKDTLVHLHGENVYWGLSSSIRGVRIHYGIHPTNPAPVGLAQQAQLPVVAGIPVSELTRITSKQQAQQLLELHFTDTAEPLLTGNCVLPLNFSDQQTDFWIQSFSQLLN
ncbi:uroporphyrinogen decarboxylase family protein [Spirosoma linguale]